MAPSKPYVTHDEFEAFKRQIEAQKASRVELEAVGQYIRQQDALLMLADSLLQDLIRVNSAQLEILSRYNEIHKKSTLQLFESIEDLRTKINTQ